ncbi:hypothetical protein [Pseudogulbenkiania sp. MAI-1]|uniref:hypothetical protein n=1 Tax=Pseudogulbenkiania sp. MAI-1 TaxID=990370 RepID=UPI00045E820E|nr:hypothetical protein [Pseudogulbenkiania sp. MAI-1]
MSTDVSSCKSPRVPFDASAYGPNRHELGHLLFEKICRMDDELSAMARCLGRSVNGTDTDVPADAFVSSIASFVSKRDALMARHDSLDSE